MPARPEFFLKNTRLIPLLAFEIICFITAIGLTVLILFNSGKAKQELIDAGELRYNVLLAESKIKSDKLVDIQGTAMNLLETADMDSGNSRNNKEKADQILFGTEYHKAKESIIEHIKRLHESIDNGTRQKAAEVERLGKEYQKTLNILIIITVASCISIIAAIFISRKGLVSKIKKALKGKKRKMMDPMKLQEKIEKKEREIRELKEAAASNSQGSIDTEQLLKGARAILEYNNFEKSSRIIFDFAKEITGAKSGYVALLSEDGSENKVLFLDSGGLPCTVDPELPMPIRGMRSEAYRLGKVVYENDFIHSGWVEYMPEGHIQMRNVLFAPLIIDGKVMGLMGLANKPEPFSDEDAEMAQAFGELAAVALNNSRLMENLAKTIQERDSLMQDVKNNEKSYRTLLDESIAGIGVSYGEKIIFANKALCKIYGIEDIEEFKSKSLLEYATPDSRKKIIERMERLKAGKPVPDEFEHDIIRMDGEIRTLSLHVSDIVYEEKKCRQSSFIDITDKKRLAESEEKFRFISENVNDLIVVYDEHFNISYASPALAKLFGYSQEDFQNMSVFDAVCDMDNKELQEKIRQRVESKTRNTLDRYRVRTKSGDIKWVETHSTYDYNPSGQLTRVISVIRDITARKEAEDALQKAHDELESIVASRTLELSKTNIRLENEIHERVAKEKQLQTWLDNSPDCTKVVDLDLNLQYMSSAGVKGLKIDDVTEFYGKPYPFEFYPETFKNTMRNNIIKAKETGRTIIQEAPVVDIQGNEVWYHSTIVPVKDDEDQIEYFLIVSIDTTERKRAEIEISNHRENLQQLVSDRTAELEKEIKDRKNAEEQIKMNLEEKETLLKEIHHRVKNNMNVVSSLLSLHKNVTQNTEVKKALRESQGRIYAMSAVHETLYNSKSLADIDLIGYLKKLSASLLQTYSVNPGNVQMTVDGENVNVNIDKASPLGLAVNELISNALKYAFPDNRTGCIEIITGRKGDHLELNIKDNGVGMPDGFDWENSNTLGLKLVRNLVESQLNGSINMDNRDGTKFTLKLKLGP